MGGGANISGRSSGLHCVGEDHAQQRRQRPPQRSPRLRFAKLLDMLDGPVRRVRSCVDVEFKIALTSAARSNLGVFLFFY